MSRRSSFSVPPAGHRRTRCPGHDGLHGFAPRVPGGAVSFSDVGSASRHLFAAGRPIIGICAAGILIRSLAPLLADKRPEPPVIAVAEDGSRWCRCSAAITARMTWPGELPRRSAASRGHHRRRSAPWGGAR